METYEHAEGTAGAVSVLVVDDDPTLRNMVATVLEEEGLETVTAENGEAALRCIAEHPVQLVILDLAMPVMDGRSFFLALRRRGDPTPVLIVSGDEPARVRRELGADAALSKPFDLEELVDRVHSLLAA
jgi:DNA-binding response OmpR family regulator